MKFKVGDVLKHATNGDTYKIIAEPNDMMLLEATGDRFYAYRANGGNITWHRCEREMDDGRFVRV